MSFPQPYAIPGAGGMPGQPPYNPSGMPPGMPGQPPYNPSGMPQQPGAFPGTPQQPQQPQQPGAFPGMPQQPQQLQQQQGPPSVFPAQPGNAAPQGVTPQNWTPAASMQPQMPVASVKPSSQEDPSKGLRLIIGPAVLSYPHLWEPQAAPGTANEPKYSCEIYVYESNPEYARITQSVQDLIQRISQSCWRTNWPNGKNQPIRNLTEVAKGQFVETTGHRGWFLRAKSNTRPPCFVGPQRLDANADDMYSGCLVYVSVTALPYDNQTGGRGIHWALNALLKVAEGPRLGGGKTGREEFAVVPETHFNLATPEQILGAQGIPGGFALPY